MSRWKTTTDWSCQRMQGHVD